MKSFSSLVTGLYGLLECDFVRWSRCCCGPLRETRVMSNEPPDTTAESDVEPLRATRRATLRGAGLAGLLALGAGSATAQRTNPSANAHLSQNVTAEPLPSWNDG